MNGRTLEDMVELNGIAIEEDFYVVSESGVELEYIEMPQCLYGEETFETFMVLNNTNKELPFKHQFL